MYVNAAVRDISGAVLFTNCDGTPPYLDKSPNRENLAQKISDNTGQNINICEMIVIVLLYSHTKSVITTQH